MEETYSGARPDTNQTLSNQNVFDINHQMIHVIYTEYAYFHFHRLTFRLITEILAALRPLRLTTPQLYP